ncbi:uncharacterized protein LOC120345634 [Styela clava]
MEFYNMKYGIILFLMLSSGIPSCIGCHSPIPPSGGHSHLLSQLLGLTTSYIDYCSKYALDFDDELLYEIAENDPELVETLEAGQNQWYAIMLDNLWETETCQDPSLEDFCEKFEECIIDLNT